jgi:hypothetical protein
MLGLTAVLMMWINGRILRVSGFTDGLITPQSDDRIGKFIFLLGIVVTGALVAMMIPAGNPGALASNPILLIGAALAVGFAPPR